MNLRTCTACGLGLLLTACGDYQFAEQDIALGFNAEADVLVLTVDSRGLFAPPGSLLLEGMEQLDATLSGRSKRAKGRQEKLEQELDKAEQRVRAVAQGARYLHLLTWPFIFDLDQGFEDMDEVARERPDLAPLVEQWKALEAGITVEDSGVYLDQQGDVAVYQRLEIAQAAAFVQWLNRAITAGVAEMLGDNRFLPLEGDKEPGLMQSEASRALLAAFVADDGQWVALGPKAIEVRVPMTPKDLATLLKGALADGARAGDSAETVSAAAIGAALLHGLDEIDVLDGVVSFRFPFDGGGRVRMPLRGPRSERTDALCARFEGDELAVRNLEQVRALLEGGALTSGANAK